MFVFLLSLAFALNPQHRLVMCWDNIEFFDMDTGESVVSVNMTSFPYIDGVSIHLFIL
jgi:hypothetical protein